MRTVLTFFRLRRLGLRTAPDLLLGTVWAFLICTWWLWLLLIVAAWVLIQSRK